MNIISLTMVICIGCCNVLGSKDRGFLGLLVYELNAWLAGDIIFVLFVNVNLFPSFEGVSAAFILRLSIIFGGS